MQRNKHILSNFMWAVFHPPLSIAASARGVGGGITQISLQKIHFKAILLISFLFSPYWGGAIWLTGEMLVRAPGTHLFARAYFYWWMWTAKSICL